MQKYQSMKDSGVPWLGDIPAEWEQKQARYIFKQAKDSVGEDPSKYELLSLTLRGIIPRSQVDGGMHRYAVSLQELKMAPADRIIGLRIIPKPRRASGRCA